VPAPVLALWCVTSTAMTIRNISRHFSPKCERMFNLNATDQWSESNREPDLPGRDDQTTGESDKPIPTKTLQVVLTCKSAGRSGQSLPRWTGRIEANPCQRVTRQGVGSWNGGLAGREYCAPGNANHRLPVRGEGSTDAELTVMPIFAVSVSSASLSNALFIAFVIGYGDQRGALFVPQRLVTECSESECSLRRDGITGTVIGKFRTAVFQAVLN